MKELIRFDEETQRTFLKEVSERNSSPDVWGGPWSSPPFPIESG